MNDMRYVALALLAALGTLGGLTQPARADTNAGPATGSPGDPVQLAIVPSIAVNLEPARVDALAAELADALATELEVEALGGLEVRRKLPADGVPPDCIATPACVTDVAHRLGADQLLFVVMVDTGGSIQVDSTWVDPATGASVSRPAIDLASLGDARARFAAAARQLLPDARVRVQPSAAPAPIGTMSPAVPRHFTTAAKITGGAALVGLGVGIGFGLAARSRYDACDAAPAMCSEDDRDAIRDVALVADLGYLVAVGATVATAVMFATSGEASRLIVAPSPDGVAVAAVGRF